MSTCKLFFYQDIDFLMCFYFLFLAELRDAIFDKNIVPLLISTMN